MTNQAFSTIVNQLSYEARNSLNASFKIMQLADAAKEDQPEWWRCAEAGRASADRMLRCLDDLGYVFSGEEPQQEEIGTFDLTESLQEITGMLSLTGGEPGQRLMFEAAQPIPFRQQKRGVEQVLMGVLSTACKAGPGWIRVSAEARGHDARVKILCTDAEVPGLLAAWMNASIDNPVLPESDDLLFAAAMLAAGKRLRRLQGKAQVDQEPGVLAVTFSGRESGWEEETGALSILAVEDCDDSFALSQMLLKEERIARAHNGNEALRLIQNRRFDMVLMDVHMPGMDGYTAIRAIREWETQTGNARTPIVILSSDEPETQRREAARSGCSGFLRKPLRQPELAGLMGHLKAIRSHDQL